MAHELTVQVMAQPDDTSCGPACLHAVYKYYNDDISLRRVINEVRTLETGGTLAILLGVHALKRGYNATIYTYDIELFDPTWDSLGPRELEEKLHEQIRVKFRRRKLKAAAKAALEFLDHGGKFRFDELAPTLIAKHLKREEPIITGLSSTYLYKSSREIYDGKNAVYDDVRGDPTGHFIILRGYKTGDRIVSIADPYKKNPMKQHHYDISIQRVMNAILLGVVTYDANLLVVTPK